MVGYNAQQGPDGFAIQFHTDDKECFARVEKVIRECIDEKILRDNVTLGEIKAHCKKRIEELGDEACRQCKYCYTVCGESPHEWELTEGVNFRETLNKALDRNRQLEKENERLADDNARLNILVKASLRD